MTRFEYLDHTADIGMRVFGESLEQLFQNANLGLLSYIVEGLDELRPTASERVELIARDDAELLIDWLNDRLYRFDAHEQIHAWATLEQVGEGRLLANSGYRLIDWERDTFRGEVKSATYHGLRLEREADLWVAEVVFDL